MFENYFKVALRSIFRNRLTAFINIAGLALAIACTVMIYLFVTDELSYDRYHSKAERIYRVTRSFHSPEGVVNLHLANVAPPIGPLLKNDFGEIETLARTINTNLVVSLEENGEVKMMNTEQNSFFAEPNIFKIFDINILHGDKSTALSKPFTIMLSEKTASRYFNNEDAVGKRLRVNNAFDVEVVGVFQDFPLQSHWHPDFFVSFNTLEDDNIYGRSGLETNWGNNSFGTYFLLQEGANANKLQAGLSAFMDKHFGNVVKQREGAPADFVASKVTTLHVQRLTDIHLHSHLDDEIEVNGNINTVYTMSVIGLFIVLIACFNFINLSTARATKRAKEVGLRKVVGAVKNQLIFQYLSESVLIALFALVISLIIVMSTIGLLNDFTSKALSLNNPLLLAGALSFALVIGILAGFYPAFVISGFKPALTLKGQQGTASGKTFIRKALVISQFSISIVLIIATLITFQQLDYLNSSDLGYKKEQVVTIPYYNELVNNYDAFYNAMKTSSTISNVARSSRTPTGRLLDSYGGARIMKGDSLIDAQVNLKSIAVDEDFFDTYKVGFAAGRNFSKDIATDDSLAFIINETAAREMGWKDLNAKMNSDMEYAGVKGKLVGVVKDFHFESLHQPITPMIFLVRQNNFNSISVSIAGNNMQAGLEALEKQWKEFLPARPFQFTFLSEQYKKLYDSEIKQNQLLTTFAGIAIFIASLGLFGLATFNTMQRVKEIGVRKVLGASVPQILQLLSKEIIILIIISNVIAWPVAWYFMSKWLNTFAYHINMNVLVYIGAALAAIAVALITVSTQTFKAAMTNPSTTLRHE